MATNNFYVFDENTNNIMSLADYSSSTTRANGVVSGIADSMLHNRLYKQTSIMVAALGQVIADSGTNASDSDLAALVSALKATLVVKSGGAAITVSDGGTGASTFTTNAVLTGNGSGALKAVATSPGAAYATASNGTLTFGTLPVAQGGTGISTATNINSVIIGGSTATGAFQTVKASSGAFYALGSDSKPQFGTLPVAQGGTGQTTVAAFRNSMGLGSSTGVLGTAYGGTGASSVDTTPTANSTKMVTSGGVKTALDLKANLSSPSFTGTPTAPTAAAASNNTQIATTAHVKSVLNRSNAVNASDTNYTTIMARGIKASTADLTAGTTSLTNGVIYLVYEAD